MRGLKQKIFLSFLVHSFLFGPSFLQVTDFQTAWVKTVFSSDTFTGKVVRASEGDTISVMCGGRAVKVRLYGIDCPDMKPFPEMDCDEVRIAIDEAIAKFLGIQDLSPLRRLLAREPVVCLRSI